MKKFVVTALCMLAFSLPSARAQSANPPLDPAAVAAVQDLLASMKYRELMVASFAQMEATLPETFKAGIEASINANTSLNAREKKDALALATKEMPNMLAAVKATFHDPSLIDEMLVEIVPMYARHFSAAEIRELAAFYKTPLGAKMLTKMPEILNESVQMSQRLVMPRIGAVIDNIMQGKH